MITAKKAAFAACSLFLPGLGQLFGKRVGWALACAAAALLWWFLPEITRSLSLAIIAGHKDPLPILTKWQAGYERSFRLLWFVRATIHVASAYDAVTYPLNGQAAVQVSLAQRIITSAIGVGAAVSLIIPASLSA